MRQNITNPQVTTKVPQLHHLSDNDILHLKKLTLNQQLGYIKDLQQQYQYLQSYLSYLQSQQQKSDQELKDIDDRILEQKRISNEFLQRYDALCLDDSKDINQRMERAIQQNLRIFQEAQCKYQDLEMNCLNAKEKYRKQSERLRLKQAELDAEKMEEHKLRLLIAEETQKFMLYESKMNKLKTSQQKLFNNRKKLNNDLQEFKGNIRVFCRVRPRKTQNSVITTTSGTTLKLTLEKEHIVEGSQKYQQGYFFEQIFKQTDTQETIFSQLLQLINNAVDGKNVCIFAYGQTGSGKTYTLLGPQSYLDNQQSYNNRGLAYRSIEYIFEQVLKNQMFNWKYNIKLSIYEIYLDTIIDLIANTPSTIDGLVEIKVKNSEEVYAYVKKAISARKTSATNANQRSSRSHLIITLNIEGEMKNSPQKRNGSLVLVDLAGSERIKQSKVEGQALKQTLFINKSLSSLGTVINGIRRKSDHVPFRNSKLTHSLQPYLEGDSKTLMFINISPDSCDSSQTKISLSFAESVRECKINK